MRNSVSGRGGASRAAVIFWVAVAVFSIFGIGYEVRANAQLWANRRAIANLESKRSEHCVLIEDLEQSIIEIDKKVDALAEFVGALHTKWDRDADGVEDK